MASISSMTLCSNLLWRQPTLLGPPSCWDRNDTNQTKDNLVIWSDSPRNWCVWNLNFESRIKAFWVSFLTCLESGAFHFHRRLPAAAIFVGIWPFSLQRNPITNPKPQKSTRHLLQWQSMHPLQVTHCWILSWAQEASPNLQNSGFTTGVAKKIPRWC